MTNEPVVTINEALGVVAGLGDRSRQPSYWILRRASCEFAAIDPLIQRHARAAVLLRPADVALCRLWDALVDDGIRRSVAAAILANHRAELLAAFRRERSGRVLVVRGVCGEVLTADEAEGRPGMHYPLDDCTKGVREAMRRIRKVHPCVWNGRQFVRPREVDAVPSSRVALTA